MGIASAEGLCDLLLKDLGLTELLEQRLVEQVLDVLRIVKSGRRVGRRRRLLLVAWLAGIDSLPDTEFAKVRQGDLELADGLGPGDEVLGLARGAFLDRKSVV